MISQFKLIAFGMLGLLLLSCGEDDINTSIGFDDGVIEGNGNSVSPDISDIFDLNFSYTDIAYPIHYNNGVLNNDNEPNNNRVNDAEANLGRVLFYDTNLSVTNSVSCASCHLQSNGFTDSETLSRGHNGGRTVAHSMRLGNIRFFEEGTMFWDKRAMTLEEQILLPIQDAIEMGFDASNGGLAALVAKLEQVNYYPELFRQVYGSDIVTVDGIQRSLAQFVRSMVSIDSKFDRGLVEVYNPNARDNGLGQSFPNFSQSENNGKALFIGRAGCDRCHDPITFALTDNARGNGLDEGETIVFKSPSLKNAGLTGPYMHDGRFNSLMEVIEHYNSGILPGPALDNRLMNGRGGNNGVERLNLSNQDKLDLVAFLQTLTDETLISDPKFSSPF